MSSTAECDQRIPAGHHAGATIPEPCPVEEVDASSGVEKLRYRAGPALFLKPRRNRR